MATAQFDLQDIASLTRKCTKCGFECALAAASEYFYKRSTGLHGLAPTCNICDNASTRSRYREKHPEIKRRAFNPDSTVKTCARCGFECPVGSASLHFYKTDKSPDGLLVYCKSCLRGKSKARHKQTTRIFDSRPRMVHLLSNQVRDARSTGYALPTTTPEAMIAIWKSQDGLCAACLQPFTSDELTVGRNRIRIAFDHDHKTGEPRGFVHQKCNIAEGWISKMSDAALTNWLRFYRPGLLLPDAPSK